VNREASGPLGAAEAGDLPQLEITLSKLAVGTRDYHRKKGLRRLRSSFLSRSLASALWLTYLMYIRFSFCRKSVCPSPEAEHAHCAQKRLKAHHARSDRPLPCRVAGIPVTPLRWKATRP
jgi:hypothetical protein